MGRTFPTEPGHGSPPEVEVADLVAQVARRLRRQTRTALDPFGVTWGQVRALRAMHPSEEDGPVRMSVLADRLGVARRSATSVVDDLVDKGLATRSDDPSDRRAVVVGPTARGRRVLERIHGVRTEAAAELVSDLTPDEIATLTGLLRRLLPDDPGATA